MADSSTTAFMPPPLIPTDVPDAAANQANTTADRADGQAFKTTETTAPLTSKPTREPMDDRPVALHNGSASAIAEGQTGTTAEEQTGTIAEEQTSTIAEEQTGAIAESEPHFPTAEEIRQEIYDVVDPEINISIIDLGLVYDIIPMPDEGKVQINMTLTSPGCPLGPEITSAVYLKVSRMPLVKECQVELVWTPMWDPNVNPTEETRLALGIW